jgi:hypothetical protein
MARQRRAGQAVENATPDVERAAEASMIAEPPAEGWDGPRAVRYTMPLKLSAPDNDLDDPDLLALNRVRGIGPARFRLLFPWLGYLSRGRRARRQRLIRHHTGKAATAETVGCMVTAGPGAAA